MVNEQSLRDAVQGRSLRIMFEDEARFGRINDPRRCWAPYPIRPLVKAAIVREFTYAFAAVSPHDGALDTLILPEVSTRAMNMFLHEVAGRHPNDFILMIMDSAGWHKARGLKIPENMRILHLPPYSPELNPVEHLWDEIREKEFPNKVFGTLDMLELTLMHGLARMENSPERVKSITGWPWIITVNLNAI
jgi:DDE superfamily endonuclease